MSSDVVGIIYTILSKKWDLSLTRMWRYINFREEVFVLTCEVSKESE